MAIGNLVKRGIGGVGGAALGAGALAGGAISQSIGFTPFLVGAAALGAAGKKGADWLGSKSLSGMGSGGKDKEDTTEELGKVTQYGMLSVEKLDAIYNNVVDIRKVLADQDPESQEREKALDEKVKQEELIDAIRGIGTGGGSGGKDNKDWSKLLSGLGLGALLGTAALIDEEDIKKLDEFFEGAGSWADSIQNAVDNIMEFVKDLDGFFEGLGIEFAGAAMMGTAAGMRRAGRSGRLQARGAKVQARKQAERQARQEKRRAAREQKRAARLQERAKVAEARRIAADEKAKAKAAAKARAAKLRSDRIRARNQRAKAAAARIKERISKVRTQGTSRARTATGGNRAFRLGQVSTRGTNRSRTATGGNRAFRLGQVSTQGTSRARTATGGNRAFRLGQVATQGTSRSRAPTGGNRQFRLGQVATQGTSRSRAPTGGNRAFRLGQVSTQGTSRARTATGGNRMFRAAAAAVSRWTGMGAQTGAAYKAPAIPLRTPNILDEPSRLRDTAPQRSGPMNRGGVPRGLTTLTPAPFRDPSVLRDSKPRSGPRRGGRVARALTTLTPIATKMFGGRSTGTGGRPLSDFPEVKAVTTPGAGRGRPGSGQPVRPKVPPKVALALRVLPSWAIKLIAKATGETAKAVGMGVLRVAGPILLAYEVYNLNKQWKSTKKKRMNWSPLGNDEEADVIWQDGIKHLAATYGGGYFGAVAGSMVGTMMGGPVGTVVGGLLGGFGGAMLGSNLYESLTKTDQEKLDEKKAELAKLTGIPENKVRGYGGKLIDYNPNNARQRVKYEGRMERITELESEIQDLLGTSIDEGNIIIINSSNVDQSRHSSSAATSTAAIRMGDSSSPVSIYDDTGGGFW